MLNRETISRFASRTDDELQAEFEAIGTLDYHRVKSGRDRGCITLRAVKHGNDILAELKRRRIERGEEA